MVVGAESSFGAGGLSRHQNGVRQDESFQPSCKSRNLTESGYSDTSENSEIPQLPGTFVEFMFFSPGFTAVDAARLLLQRSYVF